ncbi:MAG: HAMP domain-containing histidine kinase [Flavobacteriaceae bacterium]|nr:HAMP domain-containing histidine kinase [Flavobacteriaceae bacterium]
MQTSPIDWSSRGRWAILTLLSATILFILWSIFRLVKQTEVDERQRMEVWALAQQQFIKNIDFNSDVDPLIFEVLTSEKNIPMIIVNENDQIVSFNNIDPVRALASDSLFLKNTLKNIKKENPSIEIIFENAVNQRMYYGNSSLLGKLRFYPLALLLLLFSLGGLIFFYLRTTQVAIQNKLWTGMAKETAHQLGTPLSSLMGWVSLLKEKHVDNSIISPMEGDIQRLETIANRFSKIGSLPKKSNTNIVGATREVFEYLSTKASQGVAMSFSSDAELIELPLNRELYCWVIENLINNAIDAVVDKGRVELQIRQTENTVFVNVIDNGKGISKRLMKIIFRPGVTTKSRGWGLGLSLCRRIIEDYHQGSIRLVSSEKDKQTHFQITLQKDL